MKREFLKSLELSDEQIATIMAEHGKTVNELNGKVTAMSNEKDTLSKQLDERDTQLNQLKESVKDNDALTNQINELQSANEKASSDAQAQLTKVKKDYEVKIALEKSGALNAKATIALLDLDTVKILDDGTVQGLSEQLESVKESNPFLFKSDEPAEPQDPQKPQITLDQNSNGTTVQSDPFDKLVEKYK